MDLGWGRDVNKVDQQISMQSRAKEVTLQLLLGTGYAVPAYLVQSLKEVSFQM